MRDERIISALIGLVGACGSNPKTEDTDRVMLEALSFIRCCPEAGEAEIQKMVERIHEEKFAVSPGCAQCAMPCGNTSDYDMQRLSTAAPEIRTLKLRLLEEIRETACLAQGREIDLLYQALAYVGYDVDEAMLQSLLERMKSGREEDR